MRFLAVFLLFLSALCFSLAQEELYADPTVSSAWEGQTQAQPHKMAKDDNSATLQLAANVPEGGGPYQADRYVSENHQSEFARPYMYSNPAFPEFYSNFYDNDGTQFYFYYQNDNSNAYNESPSNYNNEPDYSENFPGPEAQ